MAASIAISWYDKDSCHATLNPRFAIKQGISGLIHAISSSGLVMTPSDSFASCSACFRDSSLKFGDTSDISPGRVHIRVRFQAQASVRLILELESLAAPRLLPPLLAISAIPSLRASSSQSTSTFVCSRILPIRLPRTRGQVPA